MAILERNPHRWIFTCGGTAGHVNPAIALAQLLGERDPEAEFLFVGAERGLEKDLVPKAGYPFETVHISSFHRSMRPAEIRRAAEAYVKEFRIKPARPDALLCELSGGNQQKVAMAKGLDTRPEIFIFDEPTRGVDIAARRDIYEFIRNLANGGVACLLISSDMEEILGMCGRVMVMRAGAVAGFRSGEELTQEELMYLAIGVERR